MWCVCGYSLYTYILCTYIIIIYNVGFHGKVYLYIPIVCVFVTCYWCENCYRRTCWIYAGCAETICVVSSWQFIGMGYINVIICSLAFTPFLFDFLFLNLFFIFLISFSFWLFHILCFSIIWFIYFFISSFSRLCFHSKSSCSL